MKDRGKRERESQKKVHLWNNFYNYVVSGSLGVLHMLYDVI